MVEGAGGVAVAPDNTDGIAVPVGPDPALACAPVLLPNDSDGWSLVVEGVGCDDGACVPAAPNENDDWIVVAEASGCDGGTGTPVAPNENVGWVVAAAGVRCDTGAGAAVTPNDSDGADGTAPAGAWDAEPNKDCGGGCDALSLLAAGVDVVPA